jgi:hypothetical protein
MIKFEIMAGTADGWMVASILEESPDSSKQRCRVIPGRGNPMESATESKPPVNSGKGERVG